MKSNLLKPLPAIVNARSITFFETDSGRCPVGEYIKKLRQPRERAQIIKTFEAVEQIADIPGTTLKKLQGKLQLWEIRVKQHRFMGFYAEEKGGVRKLVLVSAFAKQSNSTPAQEIEVATQRRQAYLQAHGRTLL